MRNKTIYVLLFVMTFTIMHDTFISLLHPKEMSHTIHCNVHEDIMQEMVDTHSIHSMFHFSAVMVEEYISFENIYKSKISSYYTFFYTPPYKDRAQKPPIA